MTDKELDLEMADKELKDKLISEAQNNWNKLDMPKRLCGSEFSYYDGYVDCGIIKEKQIQIDAEQIRALQKQNGELTDELKALRESTKDYGAGCYENGLKNGKRAVEKDIERQGELLEKAMKLLEKWVEVYEPKVGDIPPAPIQEETERFLSEVKE